MNEHSADKDAPPTPADRDWSAWATLANNVSEALVVLPERPLFSQRNAVAEALWRMGYRPSEQQIAAEIERQRRPEHHRDCPVRYYPDHPERCRCSILRELDRSGTRPLSPAECDGCLCPTEHDGDYGSAGHAGPCPPHTCGTPTGS